VDPKVWKAERFPEDAGPVVGDSAELENKSAGRGIKKEKPGLVLAFLF
jgi:hypothetical protein